MKPKISIRKVVLAFSWLAVGISILILLVAANRKKHDYLCKDVVITIKGVSESFYIDKNDIKSSLKKSASGNLVNEHVADIKLGRLEKGLEKNPWIKDAELYFDSRNVLHVSVTERQPIARVFTTTGTSFYIDTGALRMPLLEGVSIRVPVVTNFTAAKRLNKKDSVLLNEVKVLARYVTADNFWNAQVAQIDIVDGRRFELVPTIGNHIIRLGNAENLDKKFHRLMVFYKQVLSKTGFEKYAALDVQYEGQVIGVQKGITSKVDSIQLQKNIEELMKRSQLNDEEQQPMNMNMDSTRIKVFDAAVTDTTNSKRTIGEPSNTTKTTNTKPGPTLKKPIAKPKPVERGKRRVEKPKAVMKKKRTSP